MINEKDYDFKVSAAGRVNIIGEHVDYCGGKVFPAALSVKNTVYIKANGTNEINLSWTTLKDKVTLDVTRLEDYKDLKYGNYQAGALLMMKNAGHKVVGCDMVQDCTVPFGSGLSSSAAIEVSTIASMLTLTGKKIDKKEVALLAQKAEREYAGVNCGIMDQFASANGRENTAMLLDCKTLECEFVPFDLKEYSLVIINCNKPHNLVESKYNERREETEAALKALRQKLDVTCLADVTPDEFEKYSYLLQGKVLRRAKHVVYECKRVEDAAVCMKNGDVTGLGELLRQSHESLRDLYEVTGKELDALYDAAVTTDGCVGSRMTGAGFGGCTVSIVKTDKAENFKKEVLKKYKDEIGYDATCYDCGVKDGIIVEKL